MSSGLHCSTVINQPLDSKPLTWLAIPATQPWGHLGPCHTVLNNSGKKKGVEKGKQKNKKNANAENNHLKKRPHNTLCSMSGF